MNPYPCNHLQPFLSPRRDLLPAQTRPALTRNTKFFFSAAINTPQALTVVSSTPCRAKCLGSAGRQRPPSQLHGGDQFTASWFLWSRGLFLSVFFLNQFLTVVWPTNSRGQTNTGPIKSAELVISIFSPVHSNTELSSVFSFQFSLKFGHSKTTESLPTSIPICPVYVCLFSPLPLRISFKSYQNCLQSAITNVPVQEKA